VNVSLSPHKLNWQKWNTIWRRQKQNICLDSEKTCHGCRPAGEEHSQVLLMQDVQYKQAREYLPGLHDLVSDMDIGQEVQGVSLDAGWGE
jgi:hypothetical protein